MSKCYGQFGPISIGDCGPKSENIVDTKSITQSISTTAQNSATSTDDRTIVVQGQNIVVNGKGPQCCNALNINQTANLKMYSQNKINNDFSNQISRTVIDNIDNKIDAVMESNKGALATDTAKLKQVLKTATEKYFQNATNQNNIQALAKRTIANQNTNVVINCAEFYNSTTGKSFGPVQTDAGCNINQQFVLDSFSLNVIDNVLKNISTETAVTQVMNELKSKLKSKSEGISDIISSYMAPLIIGAIVLFIIIGVVLFFFLKSNKSIKSGPGGFSVGRIRSQYLPSSGLNIRNRYKYF